MKDVTKHRLEAVLAWCLRACVGVRYMICLAFAIAAFAYLPYMFRDQGILVWIDGVTALAAGVAAFWTVNYGIRWLVSPIVRAIDRWFVKL